MVTAAGIYARISSDPDGDRLGVTRQREDCEALAARKGWPVHEVYIDDDRSAYSGKPRPEYLRMLGDIGRRTIDAVLVYNQDRLHRQPRELEAFLDLCESVGLTKVSSVEGDLDLSTSDGRMVARMLAAVAKKASEDTGRRLRRKNDERALAGLPVGGGSRPFGYRDDRLAIDPDEADLIREAAARIIAGDSLRSIVGDWAERGVATPRGGPWSLQTFRRMIASPRLSGQREHRGEIVAKAAWEPILTPAQTATIRSILAANRHARRRPTRSYFLTGILHCGRCGATLISRPDAKGHRRYICASGVGQAGCGGLALNAEPVEALVAEAILIRLDSPAVAAALAGAADADAASAPDRDSLAADGAQLEELARDHAERRITRREWLAARDIIEARIEATRKRLSRLSQTAAVDPYLGHGGALRAEWPTLSLNRQRTIASAVLDRAIVHPAVPGRAVFDPQRIEPLWRL